MANRIDVFHRTEVQHRVFSLISEAERTFGRASNDFNKLLTFERKADVIRELVKIAGGTLKHQNRIAKLRFDAQRRIGKALAEVIRRGRKSKSNSENPPLTLASLGVTPDESKRCQLLAAIPDEQYEMYVQRAEIEGTELTQVLMLRFARSLIHESHNGRHGRHRSTGSRKKCPGRTPAKAKESVESAHSFEVTATWKEACDVLTELKGHQQTLANIVAAPDSDSDDKVQLCGRDSFITRSIIRYAMEICNSGAHLADLVGSLMTKLRSEHAERNTGQ